jgi:hypothetical protein
MKQMQRTRLMLTFCLALAAATTLVQAQEDREATANAPTGDAARAGEVRRGVAMGGNPEERSKAYYERVIAKVEPSLKGDPAKIPVYLELFKREFVEDTRTFGFDVQPSAPGESTLVGHVEFEEHKNALDQFFKRLGLTVQDKTELLPGASLDIKRYALVTAPRTFVYDRAAGKIERLTECERGDLVFVLKEGPNGQLLCHAPDGYVGYIAATALRRIDDGELSEIQNVTPTAPAIKDKVDLVIEEARKYLGTPYVWGAGTREGIDCSGLVRQSFKAVSLNMPRDADQQFLVGRLVGTRWYRLGLRGGDTLYFLGRRGTISHTAIYIGNGKFIEATEPVVRISSFNPQDPDYSEKRVKSFCFAKRIIE